MGLFSFIKKKPTHKEVVREPIIQTNQSKNQPVPLSDLVKSAVPSKLGLYPHEILMLEYAPQFKNSGNTFQGFWYWQYSVTDPQAVLESLIKRGFIQLGDLKSTLEQLKLLEIKEELKQINQKTTGKKEELIDRLLEYGNHEILKQKHPERYYTLTSKGKSELQENEYVIYLHRNKYLSVWEMNQKLSQTKLPYRDVLWDYFNKQSIIHARNFDFGFYRNVRLNMYQFLMEEKKFQEAFQLLCEVLSYDLSGLQNNEKNLFEWEKSNPQVFLEIYKLKLEYYFPYKEENKTIAPAVSKWFAQMQERFKMNNEEFRTAVFENMQKIQLPQRIFSDEECADIIIADISGNTKALESIFRNAEKREKIKLKQIKSKIK